MFFFVPAWLGSSGHTLPPVSARTVIGSSSDNWKINSLIFVLPQIFGSASKKTPANSSIYYIQCISIFKVALTDCFHLRDLAVPTSHFPNRMR